MPSTRRRWPPRLLREHVVAGGLAVQHLALARHAEALGGGAVALHLRHRSIPRYRMRLPPRPPAAAPVRARPAVPVGPRREHRARCPLLRVRRCRSRRRPVPVPWPSFAFALAMASTYFLLGAMTMIMFRPSCLGMDSTTMVFAEVRDHAVQDLATQVRVRHLAPAEHDRDLDLVPPVQEPHDVALLGGVVVLVDLGAELDLLQAGPRLLLAGLLLANVAFVLELAVVHDPAHGRIGLRRDFDEVQIQVTGLAQRLAGVDHPDLLAVGPHQAYLGRPDPVVYARIGRDPASPPGRRTSTGHALSGPVLRWTHVLQPGSIAHQSGSNRAP